MKTRVEEPARGEQGRASLLLEGQRQECKDDSSVAWA